MSNLKPQNMKKLSLTFIFVFCTLALAAQDDVIRVNYKGANPTISDFVWAYLSASVQDDEEVDINESLRAMKFAWAKHRKGAPQDEGTTLTVDHKNGYVLAEFKYEEDVLRIEMCYWNEADRKHKLFACSVASFMKGKYEPGQYDGLTFYRYDNATKKMTYCDDVGFEKMFATDNGGWVSYALPRVGKDITVTTWYSNGKKKQQTLKWKGRRFSY